MSLPLLSALAANMSSHVQASARELQLAQQAIFNQQLAQRLPPHLHAAVAAPH